MGGEEFFVALVQAILCDVLSLPNELGAPFTAMAKEM